MTTLIADLLSWILLLAGSFFCLTGVIGLLRLPDFFTRVHGAGILDSLGCALILLGLAVQSGLSLTTVKLVLVLILLWVTGPTAVHALARAALRGGVDPTPDRHQHATDEASPSQP